MKAVEEEFEALIGVDLPVSTFVEAFKTNPIMIRKLSILTGFTTEELKQVSDEDIKQVFQNIDEDSSGTISYDEFVKGIVKIREEAKAIAAEAAEATEVAMVDEAALIAMEAFESADFEHKGELNLEAFINTLSDSAIVEKVLAATRLPPDFFDSLNAPRMLQLFKEIDIDHSGTISFVEWVQYLVQVRINIYEMDKAAEEDAYQKVIRHAEAAIEEGDEDWSGEFDLGEFVKAFKSNSAFLRKVSMATDIPVVEFRRLQEADLIDLFDALDTDFSGTVSFEEFTRGLVEIRLSREEQKAEEEAKEEEAAMDDAAVDLAEAFGEADWKYNGELDLDNFMEALRDISVIEKICAATHMPADWFMSLTREQMVQMFNEIDTDTSGAISFQEWLEALVKVRQATFREEKAIEKEQTQAVLKIAEEALEEADDDFNGEFDLQEFITAFRDNPKFLRKVAMATGVSAEDYAALQTEDIIDLFNALDTDYSGTVSFDEFVKGLVEIRMARMSELQAEAAAEEQAVIDEAVMDAYEAFAEADMNMEGELDLEQFCKALQDEAVVEKMAMATKIPLEWFQSLNLEMIKELFTQIDVDHSGAVDFNEWVTALIRTRQETYMQEKMEEEEAMAAVSHDAEAAFDAEMIGGEMTLEQFITAFKTHPQFVGRVSHATGVPAEDFMALQAEDIAALFEALDTDFSGTVSFDEFVKGLAEIRLAKAHGELEAPLPDVDNVKAAVQHAELGGASNVMVQDDFKLLMKELNGTWSDAMLEKLLAGLPKGEDGSVSLSAVIDFVF